ncbi:MAG: hypothetical protein AB8F95_03965 [Bacteroidia bacterium]
MQNSLTSRDNLRASRNFWTAVMEMRVVPTYSLLTLNWIPREPTHHREIQTSAEKKPHYIHPSFGVDEA